MNLIKTAESTYTFEDATIVTKYNKETKSFLATISRDGHQTTTEEVKSFIVLKNRISDLYKNMIPMVHENDSLIPDNLKQYLISEESLPAFEPLNLAEELFPFSVSTEIVPCEFPNNYSEPHVGYGEFKESLDKYFEEPSDEAYALIAEKLINL